MARKALRNMTIQELTERLKEDIGEIEEIRTLIAELNEPLAQSSPAFNRPAGVGAMPYLPPRRPPEATPDAEQSTNTGALEYTPVTPLYVE